MLMDSARGTRLNMQFEPTSKPSNQVVKIGCSCNSRKKYMIRSLQLVSISHKTNPMDSHGIRMNTNGSLIATKVRHYPSCVSVSLSSLVCILWQETGMAQGRTVHTTKERLNDNMQTDAGRTCCAGITGQKTKLKIVYKQRNCGKGKQTKRQFLRCNQHSTCF